MPESHTMIVAVDFSDHTAKVIETALEMAKALQSRVYVIHVAAPDPAFVGYEVGPQHVRYWRAEELRHEHQDLAQFRERFESLGLTATALLVAGATAEKLVEECSRLGATLIILGTHGHGKLHELLMGSTAKGVIAHTHVPTLLIPHTGD